MNLKNKSLKRVLLTGTFGVLTILGLSAATANAQTGYYDPYYNQQNNGYHRQDRRNDNHHRRNDNHHRKDEKREVKHHQRDERQEYGNSRELRRHQKEERRQVKNQQRNERRGNYNLLSYDNCLQFSGN